MGSGEETIKETSLSVDKSYAGWVGGWVSFFCENEQPNCEECSIQCNPKIFHCLFTILIFKKLKHVLIMKLYKSGICEQKLMENMPLKTTRVVCGV